MNKWYRSCGWMLVAAMAIQLSGCARHRTWLSAGMVQQKTWLTSFPLRDNGDQMLAKADGSPQAAAAATPDGASKAGLSDAQLIKVSSVKSAAASTEQDSAKEAPEAPKTPELLDETEPLELELEPESTPSPTQGVQKKSVARASAAQNGSRTQGEDRKSESDSDDLADLSEWESEAEQPRAKTVTKPSAPAAKVAASAAAKKVVRSSEQVQRKPDNRKYEPAPVRPVAATGGKSSAVELLSLCPDAEGELREQIRSLNTSDVEVLKHRLGRLGNDAAAAPALEQLLNHKDVLVRMHAAFALARMQQSTPEGVRIVVDGLKSTDPGMRSFAAATIAEMGPQLGVALEAFAESLDNRDHDGNFRFEDAEVLIRVKPRREGSNNASASKLSGSDKFSDPAGYSRVVQPNKLTESEDETAAPEPVPEPVPEPEEERIELEGEASVSESQVSVVRQRVQRPSSPAVGTFSVVKQR